MGASLAALGDPDVPAFWDSTLSKLTDPVDPTFVRGFIDSKLAQPVTLEFFEVIIQDAQAVPARVGKEAFKRRLEEDISDDPPKIGVPMLIVWGDQDVRCSRREQEAVKVMINGSWLLVYPSWA